MLIAAGWPLAGSAAWSHDPTENTRLTSVAGAQHSPVAVSDGNDGVYVAWVDDASGNSNIYVQHVDADGDIQWDADGVAIANTANNETEPQLITNANGGVYVVWESDLQNGNIYAQRLSDTGTKLWGSNGLTVSAGTAYQNNPRVTAAYGYPDGTHGIAIAYTRRPVGGDAYDR